MLDGYTDLDPTSLSQSLHLGAGFYVTVIITIVLFIVFVLYSLYLFTRIIKAIEAVIRLDENVQKIVRELEGKSEPKTDENPGVIRPA